jgi:hypothetical protein
MTRVLAPLIVLVFLAVLALVATPALAAQESSPPAGGAALGQVIGASLAAMLVTAVLLYIGFGHRSGRVRWLGRLAEWAERISGHPGWIGIPVVVSTTSLVVALFGMYWDIALHIDIGRDEGPLANPAHYFILVGLFGIFTGGFLATVLPVGKPSDTAVRIGRDWYAPLGALLIMACGLFSLCGFPLDDVWHRLFGQDVTLWGPTHLMLIGGAAMSLLGIAVLSIEGIRASGLPDWPRGESHWVSLARAVAQTGGLLLGLSTFQAEFDFGVPQFRFAFEPLMIMLASGAGLVAARLYAGRGAAVGAVAFFLVLRGLLAVTIGPVLGETTPHFPLYLVEALVVEAVALRIPVQRPLAFALWSGLGIGTAGLAAEWLWSQILMPLPWPAELFPEGALLGFLGAVSGALLGAWIGTRLSVERRPRHPGLRRGAALAAATIAGIVAFLLYTPAEEGVGARVALRTAADAGGRAARVEVRMKPADAAVGAELFNVTAWQGGDELVIAPLERVGPGIYRTADPVPVHGSWKALVRLHDGDSLTALPIYMPRDEAIPAPEVPARARFTRSFVDETQILQREQTGGGSLVTALAYAVVISVALSLLALIAWGLHRLALGPTAGGAGSSRLAAPPVDRPPRGATG